MGFRGYLCCVAAVLISLFPSRVNAQSPNSIAGWTVYSTVTGGSAPFSSSGLYMIIISNSGTTYSIKNVYKAADSSGSVSYSKTGANTASATYVDSGTGVSFTQTLAFTSSTAGSYQLQRSSGGSQTADFVAYNGTAPASVARKIFTITISRGIAPFAYGGKFELIINSENSYLVRGLSSTYDSAGNFSFTKANHSSGLFSFSDYDSSLGSGTGGLAFSSANSGLVWRTKNGQSYQVGTFTANDIPLPTITSQPVSRTVIAGTNVSFSVAASGIGPFSYQWYKNAVVIGENGSTCTISDVKSSDAGSYRVAVTGSGGTVTSSVATLTVNCNFNVSSASVKHSYTGGSGTFVVSAASGGCPWSIANSSSWISISGSTNRNGTDTVSYSVATNTSTQPRTGTLTIAGKTFVIAQGPQYAPSNIRNKTIVMTIGSGTMGKFLVVTRSGTNGILQIVPVSGVTTPTSASYTYVRSNATTASFTYNSIRTTLNFSSPTAGTFVSRRPGSLDQTGSFVMMNKTPDWDGDGRSDIAWQNSSTRTLSAWLMAGTNFVRSVALRSGQAAAIGWSAVAAGDFNNDGQSDVLFQAANSSLQLWLMTRTNLLRVIPLRPGVLPGTNRRAVSAGDFNGDNQPDVLFQDTEGRLSLWILNGTNYVTTLNVRGGQSAGAGWNVAATADFNGDRQTDILFQHTTGSIAVWLMNGPSFISSIAFSGVPAVPSGWKVIGAGDVNWNGRNDVLFRNNNGRLAAWLMNSRVFVSSTVLQNTPLIPAEFKLVSPK